MRAVGLYSCFGKMWRGMMVVAILALLLPTLAHASGLKTLMPGGTSTSTQEPAKAAPTIIPGSPLAALTGATQPPSTTTTETKAPFGTQSIGFALTAALGRGTVQTFEDFVDALRRSMRLAPVLQWGSNFTKIQRHQTDALAILRGLGIVIAPGLILDVLVVFFLRRLVSFCAKRAAPQVAEYLLAPDGTYPQIPLRLSMKGWSRRCGYALLRFLLMLVPLAAFVVFISLALASDLITNHAAHLAITGITNAYICARLAQNGLQLLIAPELPNLRLIRIPTRYARWTMRRAMILVATIAVGFCLISCAEILGLSDAGGDSLIRLVELLVHLELALWVWQCRKVVGRWISGKSEKPGVLASLRRRFAKVWYIFALFYLVGLWVAWAGGVHNALVVILRAVLVILGALVLARLAWIGCNRLLKRVFPDENEALDSGNIAFHKRFSSYNSLIQILVKAFILLLTVVLVLQGWGVDAFSWILMNPVGRALLSTFSNILFTGIGALLVWEFCNYVLDRRINNLNNVGRTRHAARLRTLRPMMRAALAVAVVMLALIIGLSRIGVNTTGLLAVSSVVGIAVGFGSQKLVQDVITGLFLLFEDAVQVGDSVTLGGISGTVERLSVRTIRLRGGDGSVNIIPFSSVSIVTNQTRDFSLAQLSIMIGYTENVDNVIALLLKIGAEMRAEPAWQVMIRDDVQIFGLDSFGELGLVITGQIRTGPGQHAAVRREFQARVQKRFLEEGIELPYRHQVLQLEIPPGTVETFQPGVAASGIVSHKNPTG